MKKIYTYFIAYVYCSQKFMFLKFFHLLPMKIETGNTSIMLDVEIKTIEQIEAIEKSLSDDFRIELNVNWKISVINYTLMRVDGVDDDWNFDFKGQATQNELSTKAFEEIIKNSQMKVWANYKNKQ